MKLTRWKSAILASFQSLLYTSPSIAAFISLVSLISSGIELTSYNTFMILSLTTVLKNSASWKMFFTGNMLADFATALRRLQKLLEFEHGDIHKYLHDSFVTNGCADLEENNFILITRPEIFNFSAKKTLTVAKSAKIQVFCCKMLYAVGIETGISQH